MPLYVTLFFYHIIAWFKILLLNLYEIFLYEYYFIIYLYIHYLCDKKNGWKKVFLYIVN